MILLQTQKVARHFGADVLFDDVTIEIKENARVGLVGRNGAGKSTLLHIISGQEEPDAGRVNKRKDLTIGYLDQHTGLESAKTIWEEMLSIFEPVIQLEKDMRSLEMKMSSPDLIKNDTEYQDVLKKYDTLQESYKQMNGYGYESEIRSVLHGFRFYEEDFQTLVSQLSGGQKTRLALAQLLLEKKDLLILDEPTNHLDIDTLSWLEKYLQNYTGALLIVSHDRYFLDKVVNEVYEVSNGKVQRFTGNYSNYLKLKAEQIQKMWKEYEKQQKEIEKTEDFINRNLVRASTTKRAQSRRKMLDKMEKMDKPQGDQQSANFNFYTARESGGVVLQTEDLAIGYDQSPLSAHIDLDIRKTDAIALVGPNGVGKTTMLKTIVGQLPKLGGTIQYGTKVDIGYYDQEQSLLHSNKSVLDELWDEHPTIPEQSIRTLLGSFLFSGEDAEKSIASLSGGEKARVALAKLAMDKNNFLILDEPTNHLDIDSKEVLENALIDFEGTLLFVSHDRYFINRMATKVIEISHDGLSLYLGDYDYYLQKKEELEALAQMKQETASNSPQEPEPLNKHSQGHDRAKQKEQQREIRRLNRTIEDLEEKMQKSEAALEDIQGQLSDPAIYDDPIKAAELTEQHDALQKEQETLLETWEAASLELESYETE
ncbi:ABC-F family ATP-binding cassette domain-containing protein [Marinilactibacillus piezotolerans]|uniref:ABC-F family ATP-binding cassette domain-containing protein n=1 Tax=Marinilactibacillus piezotolerans TaxID=258723 RepID=UPI0009AFB2AD|nr:ABC-F type ribosomal protection protein [Marinilactibacillus piezotolerans]